MGILGCTWAYKGVHGHTRIYMGIHGSTWAYTGIHRHTRVYMGIQGCTWAYSRIYMGIHGSTWAYTGIHRHTRVYMGILGSIWAYKGVLLGMECQRLACSWHVLLLLLLLVLCLFNLLIEPGDKTTWVSKICIDIEAAATRSWKWREAQTVFTALVVMHMCARIGFFGPL